MNTDQATRAFALFAPKAARGHAMTLAALVLLALLAACAGGAPGSVDISSTRPIGTDRGYASLPNIMKAKKKPVAETTPEALGVDTAKRLEVLKTEEPAGRVAGVKVASVDDLIEKLKTEAGVL